jgi:hypothetical protein
VRRSLSCQFDEGRQGACPRRSCLEPCIRSVSSSAPIASPASRNRPDVFVRSEVGPLSRSPNTRSRGGRHQHIGDRWQYGSSKRGGAEVAATRGVARWPDLAWPNLRLIIVRLHHVLEASLAFKKLNILCKTGPPWPILLVLECGGKRDSATLARHLATGRNLDRSRRDSRQKFAQSSAPIPTP